MKNNLLAIDPGDNTAYAYFRNSTIPRFTGTLRCSGIVKVQPYTEQIYSLGRGLDQLLKRIKPRICYIEGVTIWTTSLKSITSASRGNLIKLAYLVGTYIQVCKANGVGVRVVTPQEWKGQMSKEVVAKRVYREVHINYSNSHETDAVGIGLYALGKL